MARTCVACRREDEQGSLIRLAVAPDGRVVIDHPPKLKGRGAYLCPDPACVAAVACKNPFPRAFRHPVTLPEGDLGRLIADRIEARLTGLLGVARKAGRVRSGATQVEEALSRNRLALLIVATDAEPATVEAFVARAAAVGAPVARFGTKDSLARTIGQEHRAVVGIVDPGLAGKIREDLGKLYRLAGGEAAPQVPPGASSHR